MGARARAEQLRLDQERAREDAYSRQQQADADARALAERQGYAEQLQRLAQQQAIDPLYQQQLARLQQEVTQEILNEFQRYGVDPTPYMPLISERVQEQFAGLAYTPSGMYQYAQYTGPNELDQSIYNSILTGQPYTVPAQGSPYITQTTPGTLGQSAFNMRDYSPLYSEGDIIGYANRQTKQQVSPQEFERLVLQGRQSGTPATTAQVPNPSYVPAQAVNPQPISAYISLQPGAADSIYSALRPQTLNFDDLISQNLFGEVTGQKRQQYTGQLSGLDTDLSSWRGQADPIIDDILSQQYSNALRPLQAAQARGYLAPDAYEFALKELDNQRSAGRAAGSQVVSGILGDYSSQLTSIKNQGLDAANKLDFSNINTFNPQQYQLQFDTKKGELQKLFEDQVRGSLSKESFFTPQAIQTRASIQNPIMGTGQTPAIEDNRRRLAFDNRLSSGSTF